MSPSEFLKLTLRNLLFIALSVVLSTLAAFGLFLSKQPTYVADATAYVTAVGTEGATDSSYTGTLLAKQKVRSFIPVFTSRTTAERAINQLGLSEAPDAVARRLQVTAPTDSVAINIKASGPTPEAARDLADAVVSAGAEEIANLEGGPSAGVQVVPLASAGLPTKPASPLLSRYLLLGVLLGLIIGYIIALIRHRMDTRVRTVTDVEETQSSIVLGTLPADKKIGRQSANDAEKAEGESSFVSREALRKLRTNLRFVSIDNPPRAIVITSSQPRDGKSTVAVRLAQVIAASGSDVLLVDADLRRPTMANTLKIDGTLGLSGILTGDVFLDEAIQKIDPHFHALPAGRIPPNPSELLGSQRMKDLLEVLRADYQYVIIDAPPLLQVTDAALLSASADGAIVVVRSGVTRKSELSAAIRHLNSVEAPILGTVLNQVSSKRMSKIIDGNDYYGYGYGYGYGYSSAKASKYASVVPTTESKQPAVGNVPFLSPEAQSADSQETADVLSRPLVRPSSVSASSIEEPASSKPAEISATSQRNVEEQKRDLDPETSTEGVENSAESTPTTDSDGPAEASTDEGSRGESDSDGPAEASADEDSRGESDQDESVQDEDREPAADGESAAEPAETPYLTVNAAGPTEESGDAQIVDEDDATGTEAPAPSESSERPSRPASQRPQGGRAPRSNTAPTTSWLLRKTIRRNRK